MLSESTLPELETAAREQLAAVLTHHIAPTALDLDADMAGSYALTSLNKVLFLTELCEATGVDLAHFTEDDLDRMRSLRDVVEALAPHSTKGS
ncbi:acyl carrier protein [Streptomyces glomeratus]|uniref:Carrier domain-containing protein n=1 Tax=Streptomyces glomeratus TaxID=284452 RepID=A0ABP6M014_9ACTN|nr:acyl carrier protein [Streptomyces glomeratus]MCF1510072.1 acyl carrier protein [Streptomyces glomeratus]